MIFPRALAPALGLTCLLAACASSTLTAGPPRSAPRSVISVSGPTATSATSASADPSASRAAAKLDALTDSLGRGGVSVEAVRPDNGATFRYGATGGMSTASIAKLYILEVLLLQHQQRGEPLDGDDRDEVERMIENSDNTAADDLYAEIGDVAGARKAESKLGMENTQPGTDYLWGFTTTCASDYIALLRNLIAPSALSAANRDYALDLLSQVESDQRWGVSAAADSKSDALLKDGWLPSDPDRGRWIVNSVGIVPVHGHRVLLAVLTQHGASFEGGIDLVEKIAKVAASVVAPY